jgi:hypothetical protein
VKCGITIITIITIIIIHHHSSSFIILFSSLLDTYNSNIAILNRRFEKSCCCSHCWQPCGGGGFLSSDRTGSTAPGVQLAGQPDRAHEDANVQRITLFLLTLIEYSSSSSINDPIRGWRSCKAWWWWAQQSEPETRGSRASGNRCRPTNGSHPPLPQVLISKGCQRLQADDDRRHSQHLRQFRHISA